MASALRRGSAALTLAAALIGPASAPAARYLIGHSVKGRPIYAYEIGSSHRRPVLVVGCTHGNETAGIAIANMLRQLAPPPGVELWVIPVLNLDGRAADTRGNAHGVDLNRNFPYAWRSLGGIFYSGPQPLSEPESRAAYRLILRIKPRLSIWFHQHLGVVDDSKGSIAVERKFAQLVGLPLAKLPNYPGSVSRWENQTISGTAFVVELRAGSLSAAQVRTDARAVLTVAAGVAESGAHDPRCRRCGFVAETNRGRRRCGAIEPVRACRWSR